MILLKFNQLLFDVIGFVARLRLLIIFNLLDNEVLITAIITAPFVPIMQIRALELDM